MRGREMALGAEAADAVRVLLDVATIALGKEGRLVERLSRSKLLDAITLRRHGRQRPHEHIIELVEITLVRGRHGDCWLVRGRERQRELAEGLVGGGGLPGGESNVGAGLVTF